MRYSSFPSFSVCPSGLPLPKHSSGQNRQPQTAQAELSYLIAFCACCFVPLSRVQCLISRR